MHESVEIQDRSAAEPQTNPRRTPVVSLRGISKAFGGTVAVNQVDLDIYPGQVHAVVGENGAGKSTLMRVLAGFYPDYGGEIYVRGKLERVSSPGLAITLGIALVHQELCLVPELSVAENIFLGREYAGRLPGLIDPKQAERQAAQILAEVAAQISPHEKIVHLSIAKQQLVEICKGISRNSAVLILDEPTSSLTVPEIKELFAVIRSLKTRGVAIVYISHKLAEVFEIADQVTVMRDGQKQETRDVKEWNEASLVKAMVGRELEAFFFNQHAYAPTEVALETEQLSRNPHFHDVSFRVYRGEVLGIYGLIGAGRTELAESICGLAPADSGQVRIKGKAVEILNPKDAIVNEIALVPEDRRTLGLLSNLDIKSNLSLAILDRLSVMGFIRRRREVAVAEKSVDSLAIRASSVNALVTTLSGGNQQKVVLGKWLNANPQILVLDDPTRGIDVGAKAEIRAIIDRLAAEGRAIILISSELPEVMGMSDRVLVMCAGRIAGEFPRERCTDELLGACAAGVSPAQCLN